MDKYITIKTENWLEESELDFTLYDKILGKKWDKDLADDAWVRTINIGRDDVIEGYPIEIDSLIQILNKIKKQGNNFISIEHHTDHQGYVFQPKKVYQSTEEEIKSYEEEQIARKKRKEEANKLIVKLEKLKRSGC